RGWRGVVRFSENPRRQVPDSCLCSVRTQWIVAGSNDREKDAATLKSPSGWLLKGSLASLGIKTNHPIIPTPMFNRNLYIALFDKALKLLSPLDQQDALRRHQVVERESVELALGVDTIEIDVVESGTGSAVFVNQSKRRAGNVLRLSRSETFS